MLLPGGFRDSSLSLVADMFLTVKDQSYTLKKKKGKINVGMYIYTYIYMPLTADKDMYIYPPADSIPSLLGTKNQKKNK